MCIDTCTTDYNINIVNNIYIYMYIYIYCALNISVEKTKSMAFKGRDPVRNKIVIDNKFIEYVNSFNCLGNVISYKKELDIDNKLHNYLKITGFFK